MQTQSIMLAASGAGSGSEYWDALDSVSSIGFGVELFEEEIDDVIFATNQFLTDATFIGESGYFWWIMQICMCLGALFALIMGAGMAYKMMVKGEPFDPLKILRVLGIALVMLFWYGNPVSVAFVSGSSGYYHDGGVLDFLAYIPNCIGSYTHELYEIEASQVSDRFDELKPLFAKRDQLKNESLAKAGAIDSQMSNGNTQDAAASTSSDATTIAENNVDSKKNALIHGTAGMMVTFDKIVMFLALVIYRVGWWSTIFIQQIMLGMLTIFGPIQWAFSVLPKWEGAWAKWLTRYLTVHFYGAMLYFVGFYVLLLFDIVISIQIDQLNQIVEDPNHYGAYAKDLFMTAGYLLVASVVALKCLNLVPDLAAWMIPEGDTSFAARNFGEGVAQGASNSAKSIMK